MSLADCKIYNFKELGDRRGYLIAIEGENNLGRGDIPFEIKRIFYIYGTAQDVVRGSHANRKSEFLLINVHGTSKIRLSDGKDEKIVELDRPMKGLYIPKMVWKEMFDFSEDSVLLILASTYYESGEYIRNFESYLNELGMNQS